MIAVIDMNDSRWDEIVKGFKNYDVYYLSSYSKAFQLHGDGEPQLIYYEDGSGFKAINVVMKRDVAHDTHFVGKIEENQYFDFATPYGYGGFITEGQATQQSLIRLNEEYSAYCKKNGIVCEFVRFHPILKNKENMSCIYDISDVGKTISMRLETKEQIWADLTSQNRNKIRKAQNAGVEIYWGRNPKLMEKFSELYKSTMDRDQAKEYYYFDNDFFNSVLQDLKYNAIFFYATYQSEIIAISVILHANGFLHYHLSASDNDYFKFAPVNLLLYEAACWGLENGYSHLHLGGGLGGQEDSLYTFKKSFNRHSDHVFSIGRKLFNEEIYMELMEIRSREKNYKAETSYFPAYRA